jgi:lipopolysaccharide export system permease protein
VKILDRYLFGETLKAFLVTLFICALLLLVGRVFDKLGDVLESRGRATATEAALYFLLSLPFELVQVLPLIATLAVLAAVGRMARHREIVAMLSGGVSVYRLAMPVAAFGILIAASAWAAGEFVIPIAEREARRLEAKVLGKKPRERNREIVAPDMENRALYAQSYVVRRNSEEMSQATVWSVDPQTWRLRWRLDAAEASYKGDAPDGGTIWEFDSAIEHRFSGDGELVGRDTHPAFFQRELGNSLNLYLRVEKEPQEMNSWELSRYISILEDRGDSAAGLKTDLHLKIAFPLGIALLGLIAFRCAVGASQSSLMAAMGAGVTAAFAYFFLTAAAQAAGHAGLGLAPEAWAWGANAVFGVGALIALAGAGHAR